MNHRMWVRIVAVLMLACSVASHAAPGRAKSELCPAPFISDGQWSVGPYGPILTLHTTLCGRLADGYDLASVYVEVVKRFSGNPLWYNPQGLRDQVRCHFALFRQDVTFEIEPSLPYVGEARTITSRCKPKVADPDPPAKS